MKKSELKTMPKYFDKYINLVRDVELFDAFHDSIFQLENLDLVFLNKIGLKTYQSNKWTINQIFQHIADVERLLTSGTLRFARGEENYIISFDENKIAQNSKSNERKVSIIIEELISVRKSTISLFQSFDECDFQKTGINWKHKISIEAMGFNIIGHQIHHLEFIEKMYYPLV